MPQFFVESEALQNERVEIRGKEARHLQDVLRLGVGDWVVLCDGAGVRYRAEIIASRPLHVQLARGERLPEILLPCQVTLAAAVIRPQRFDWLVEKVFELGCRRLIPITTERSVAHYIKDASRQQARWSEIAHSAAKQSGLPWLPEVAPLTSLADVLKNPGGQLLYCWEGLAVPSRGAAPCTGGAEGSLRAELRYETPAVRPGNPCERARDPSATGPVHGAATILIGPEGGFSNTEHDFILSHDPQFLSLGPLILRSETAAMAAVMKVMS